MFIIIRLSFIFPFVLLLVAAGAVYAGDSSKVAKKQKEIREKTTETLTWLYELQPSAKETIENSYGYAVFSNFGMKILVAGGGKGKGEAINNKTGKETFMKMLELQAGLGMGIKRFRVVFVFESKKVFNDFINSGWEFGGQSTAAAKLDDEGVRRCHCFAWRMDISAHRGRACA